MTGAYGFIDKNGKKHVIKYTAGKDGFKVEGDVNPDIAAASQAKLPPLETTNSPAPKPTPTYQPAPTYRPPVSQPIAQPIATYQPATTPAPVVNYSRQPIAVADTSSSSAYEEARAQIAANRNKPISSAYQAPITPNYQTRTNLGQNLAYSRPVTRTAVAPAEQPTGTHLATSASSYPAAARINSRAVRKLLQTRHRQQPAAATSIDTSASSSSSVISEPIVKLKTSSSVQILSHPPPMLPNYNLNPINPNEIRMARSRAIKAFTNSGAIETSASSSKLSYTPSQQVVKKSVRPQPVVEQEKPNKIESRSDNVEASNDKIESRSDSSAVIDFPSIAMNSFLSRIK